MQTRRLFSSLILLLKPNRRLAIPIRIRHISTSVGFAGRSWPFSRSSSPHLCRQSLPPPREGFRSCSVMSELQQTKREEYNKFQEWALESGEEESMLSTFQEWMLRYNRVYEDANEKIKRYLAFKKNDQLLDALSKIHQNIGCSGHNGLFDYTQEEFSQLRGGLREEFTEEQKAQRREDVLTDEEYYKLLEPYKHLL